MSVKNSNEEAFLEIINNVPHYIFWKDKDLIFRGCNKMFAEQFGYKDQSDIIGKTDDDFPWSDELREKYRRDDLAIINTGKPMLDYEESQTQSDGSLKTVLVSKVPYCDKNGVILGVLGIYTDITKRKQMEEALRKANRVKSEFLANMSHDLKTPLSGIISVAENLRYKLTDSKDKKSVDYIMQSSERLLELLNGIIDIAKVEHHELPDHQVNFNPEIVLNELVELMTPTIQTKKLALEVNYDSAIPKYVTGNRLLIHRIILNLFSNAIKFTDEGKITISFAVKSINDNKVNLRISITDTGIGIPEDKYDQIFESFTRLMPSYENTYPGTGLGLYIVKHYVEQLGGEIQVKSQLGVGSTFTCVIPLAVSKNTFDSEKLSNITVAENETPYRTTTVRVLVVEDDPATQHALKEKLTLIGYEISLAQSGQEALALTKSNAFDLIYMDVGLPDGSGLAIAKAIRQQTKNSNTPIIALTAHADDEVKAAYQAQVIDDYLSKPLLRTQAKAMVQRWVFKQEETDQIDTSATDPLMRSNKVIDLELGAKLIHEDVEAVKTVLQDLIDNLPDQQEALQAAYQQKNLPQLLTLVHRLHGRLCYCPTPCLKQAMSFLEGALKLNDRDEIDRRYEAVVAEMDRLQEAYAKSA